jgi:hypothetical protein
LQSSHPGSMARGSASPPCRGLLDWCGPRPAALGPEAYGEAPNQED